MIAACAHALKPLFKAALNDTTVSKHKAYYNHGRFTQRSSAARAPRMKPDLDGMEMYSASLGSRQECDISPAMGSQENIISHAEALAMPDIKGITKTTDLTMTTSDKDPNRRADEDELFSYERHHRHVL